jgi:hypothetical protein
MPEKRAGEGDRIGIFAQAPLPPQARVISDCHPSEGRAEKK